MIYELYLNGEKADVRQDLGVQLSFNIDDINKFGSRDTSFSKTIVLPGTANNNKLLGFVADMGSFNTFDAGAANIGANFNVAQTTKAELRGNGLLLIKGVFRFRCIFFSSSHIRFLYINIQRIKKDPYAVPFPSHFNTYIPIYLYTKVCFKEILRNFTMTHVYMNSLTPTVSNCFSSIR